MKQEPQKRKLFWIQRITICLLLLYPAYLLLLGPFWALDGRGHLDFVPSSVKDGIYLPVYPVIKVRPLFSIYESYMGLWFDDPNAAETTE
jgi:hypothetical protein